MVILLLLLDLLPVLLPTLSAYAGLSLLRFGLRDRILLSGRLLTRGSLRGTFGCVSYTMMRIVYGLPTNSRPTAHVRKAGTALVYLSGG